MVLEPSISQASVMSTAKVFSSKSLPREAEKEIEEVDERGEVGSLG